MNSVFVFEDVLNRRMVAQTAGPRGYSRASIDSDTFHLPLATLAWGRYFLDNPKVIWQVFCSNLLSDFFSIVRLFIERYAWYWRLLVPRRKPLPASVRKIIWQKAKACCEYTDIKRGIRCQSRFALEPDHIIPLALGGTDDVNNLQLLCRAHNSRRAIQTFGIYKK